MQSLAQAVKTRLRRWVKRHRWAREQRSWEVYLFNYGTVNKWHQVKTVNSLTGVWRVWP